VVFFVFNMVRVVLFVVVVLEDHTVPWKKFLCS